LKERWGSEIFVTRGHVHQAGELMGFCAFSLQNELLGVVTFSVSDQACEIISLDALRSGIDIGTSLLNAVDDAARALGWRRIWLITTNDNTDALLFYQKRGFRITAVYQNAVNDARRIKPEILLLGLHGIEIQDEIELERYLA
jgi:ribosomal protein S18 acetylase RimI-like enzyme